MAAGKIVSGAPRRARAAPAPSRRTAVLARLRGQMVRRLGWGVADQAMSSVTNSLVTLYIARTLGSVQFGAFSLAYVTYAFALNASRGLSTDPLMVRFSGAELPAWRRAVASCTGTAVIVGLATGALVLASAPFLRGTTEQAFLALGLTLPGLMLQDSWRYSFFALGKGGHAFLNDSIWAIALIPALLVLRLTGRSDVFWFVLAWGLSGSVGALVGPLQARVRPRVTESLSWLSQQRDLGLRYFLEGTSSSVAGQLRGYGIGLLLGLAAVGYVGAATTLMGPVTILFLGMSLVTIPEAARILRRSPRHLLPFCLLVSAGLVAAGLAWGAVLLIALPRGLGQFALGSVWHGAYPLVLPQALSVAGQAVGAGAATGLHGLGAARRSLRGAVLSAAAFLVCSLVGAAIDGAYGTVAGSAVATWIAALVLWWQLRKALRESPTMRRLHGRHRGHATADHGTVNHGAVNPGAVNHEAVNHEPIDHAAASGTSGSALGTAQIPDPAGNDR